MSAEKREGGEFVRLRDIYLSAARALELANRQLADDATGDVAYAVLDSEISIPYGDILEDAGDVLLRLPGRGEPTDGSRRVRFLIKPVPRVLPDDEGSTGPTTVPDVANVQTGEALTALITAGLRIGKLMYDPAARPPGLVVGQSPEAGKEVPPGTRVDLRISGESLRIEVAAESITPRASSRKASQPEQRNRTRSGRKPR
jgi:beta-lactam-binding protein with PASTA domain